MRNRKGCATGMEYTDRQRDRQEVGEINQY